MTKEAKILHKCALLHMKVLHQFIYLVLPDAKLYLRTISEYLTS